MYGLGFSVEVQGSESRLRVEGLGLRVEGLRLGGDG